MKNDPVVSVVVPNYNHAPYLKQRIDSVLSQTYDNFELIILDDCSSDNSRDIIELYRHHPKVATVVYNEINSGSTFKQWDKGISLSKGAYIWIAESDDWCEPSLLQTLIDGLLKNPSCTVAYCQSFYVRNSNDIFHHTHTPQLTECMNGMDYVNKYLVYHSTVYNASMAVLKKETYYAISKDYTGFRFCGDWVFWSEMISCGEVFISGKLLNYFRSHGADVSTGMYDTGKSFIEQFECLLLLKQKFSVPNKIYRKALSHYTNLYLERKKNFSAEVISAIEEALKKGENRKHKTYLRKAWVLSRIKEIAAKQCEFLYK